MPLNLCCSNRVEALHARLAQRLGEAPLADPFQPELILIPSMLLNTPSQTYRTLPYHAYKIRIRSFGF